MKGDNRTKAELLEEIDALREQVRVLEKKTRGPKKGAEEVKGMAPTRSNRKPIRTHVEFIADFDVIEATGINISEGGICFAIEEDLPFEMRFEMDGQVHQHRGHLVWVRRDPDAGYQFGLMFTRPNIELSF